MSFFFYYFILFIFLLKAREIIEILKDLIIVKCIEKKKLRKRNFSFLSKDKIFCQRIVKTSILKKFKEKKKEFYLKKKL